MKCFFMIIFSIYSLSLCATTDLAYWNFRDHEVIAAGGIEVNLEQVIEWTATGTVTYTYGPGGAGTAAISLTGWQEGANSKYWLITLSTEGFQNINVSSFQYSSGYGPRDFKLQYKVNNEDGWKDIPDGEITVGTNWSAGRVENKPLPNETENQEELQIRWIMQNNVAVDHLNVASFGTSRITNIYIRGEMTSSIQGWSLY